jgi:pimeloyl-ACP methyl ester carboxylesterase
MDLHSTLIVHGNKHAVVGTINALVLVEQLPNVKLILYPDSNYGAQYQPANCFLKHVRLFLNEFS